MTMRTSKVAKAPGRRGAPALVAIAALVLAGCTGSIPADPDGTLARVEGGTLRVGVSHNPPWTSTDEAESPDGTDVELVERFADRYDARVEWTEGTEAVLVRSLERGALDLVVAGFTEDTPWGDRVAVTRPFAETRNAQGETERHVMLAPMGENAFLVALEEFLSSEGGAR